MRQCHTICQSEGDMQVQAAHSKKIPLGEKVFYMGCQPFLGVPPEGGGYKKIRTNFFPPPPPRMHTLAGLTNLLFELAIQKELNAALKALHAAAQLKWLEGRAPPCLTTLVLNTVPLSIARAL